MSPRPCSLLPSPPRRLVVFVLRGHGQQHSSPTGRSQSQLRRQRFRPAGMAVRMGLPLLLHAATLQRQRTSIFVRSICRGTPFRDSSFQSLSSSSPFPRKECVRRTQVKISSYYVPPMPIPLGRASWVEMSSEHRLQEGSRVRTGVHGITDRITFIDHSLVTHTRARTDSRDRFSTDLQLAAAVTLHYTLLTHIYPFAYETREGRKRTS
jgi:hypothetical protein